MKIPYAFIVFEVERDFVGISQTLLGAVKFSQESGIGCTECIITACMPDETNMDVPKEVYCYDGCWLDEDSIGVKEAKFICSLNNY